MSLINQVDREQFQQALGSRDERIRQLERQLTNIREQTEVDAREWRRLKVHRGELFEWLVENAMDDYGRLTHSHIDAGLRGESFVPCSFVGTIRGKRYRMSLITTDYEVSEICGEV